MEVNSPSLDQLREARGDVSFADRLPPSAEELARVKRAFTVLEMGSDHISLEIDSGTLGPFAVETGMLILCSSFGFLLCLFVSDLRYLGLHWLVPHTSWLLLLLLFASRRKRASDVRALTIFPSSPYCQLRKASLVLKTFYVGRLFVSHKKLVGVISHVGPLRLRKPRANIREIQTLVSVLNRYILYGTKRETAPPALERMSPAPSSLARWMLDSMEVLHFGPEKIVTRVI